MKLATAAALARAGAGDDANVLGGVLRRCSAPGMALTGATRSGACVEAGHDAGSHHICVDDLASLSPNFCTTTGQSRMTVRNAFRRSILFCRVSGSRA